MWYYILSFDIGEVSRVHLYDCHPEEYGRRVLDQQKGWIVWVDKCQSKRSSFELEIRTVRHLSLTM